MASVLGDHVLAKKEGILYFIVAEMKIHFGANLCDESLR